jgi:hypothetical protein
MNFMAFGVKFDVSTLIHCSMRARPWRSFGVSGLPAFASM